MKKILLIVGIIILAAAVSAGSFYGGIVYQRNQLASQRAAFAGRAGGANGAAFGQGTGIETGANAAGSFVSNTTGQVKSFDGTTLTVTTARDTTTVTFDESTRIEKAAAATTTDLVAGDRVLVTGQRDAAGKILASQVLIISTP